MAFSRNGTPPQRGLLCSFYLFLSYARLVDIENLFYKDRILIQDYFTSPVPKMRTSNEKVRKHLTFVEISLEVRRILNPKLRWKDLT